MVPTPGGNRKEQGSVVARNGQGLCKWQLGGTPTSWCELGQVYVFLAFEKNCRDAWVAQ